MKPEGRKEGRILAHHPACYGMISLARLSELPSVRPFVYMCVFYIYRTHLSIIHLSSTLSLRTRPAACATPPLSLRPDTGVSAQELIRGLKTPRKRNDKTLFQRRKSATHTSILAESCSANPTNNKSVPYSYPCRPNPDRWRFVRSLIHTIHTRRHQ